MSAIQQILASVSGASLDPDAQAFITAAGITDPIQQSAIDTLVVGLKAESLWTMCNAIYPIVGGSASSHKFNLKDPQDTDGAFRLTFSGTVTHASTGMTGNGTTGYANTFLTPSSTLSLNDTHVSIYSRTNSAVFSCDVGVLTGGSNYLQVIDSQSANSLAIINTSAVSYPTATGVTDSRGFWHANRTAADAQALYINGAVNGTSSGASTSLPTLPLFLMARNNTGADIHSAKEVAFASIGQGMTGGQAATFYTLIDAFQTTLGRNV